VSSVACTIKTRHIYNDHEKRVQLWRRYFNAHRTSPLTPREGSRYVDSDGVYVYNVMTFCGNCHMNGLDSGSASASLSTCLESWLRSTFGHLLCGGRGVDFTVEVGVTTRRGTGKPRRAQPKVTVTVSCRFSWHHLGIIARTHSTVAGAEGRFGRSFRAYLVRTRFSADKFTPHACIRLVALLVD
jgi:hypothetical protein